MLYEQYCTEDDRERRKKGVDPTLSVTESSMRSAEEEREPVVALLRSRCVLLGYMANSNVAGAGHLSFASPEGVAAATEVATSYAHRCGHRIWQCHDPTDVQ